MRTKIDFHCEKNDFVKIVSLFIRFGTFRFINANYFQHEGLAMGSPISAVLANLCMEILEREKYLDLLPKTPHWFRYVRDDVLVPAHKNTNNNNPLRALNNVNDRI